MKTITTIFVLACSALGQTTAPAGIAAFVAYNQLGSPQWTGGVSAIYPVIGSVGVYGTTTTDLYPMRAVDPATKREFYAVSASIRQGIHKTVLTAGDAIFLAGGDLGPGFSQGQPSGISVSLSSSFVATAVYRINPVVSAVVPVRMLYISGIGWNPVVQCGIVVNLKKLPRAQP